MKNENAHGKKANAMRKTNGFVGVRTRKKYY
jgi:hypothetical protein